MNHIQEFQSPNFHGVPEQCYALILLIAFFALAADVRRPRLSQLLVILFAVASGLYAVRNLPVSSLLLMLTAGPILSQRRRDAAKSVAGDQFFGRFVVRAKSGLERAGTMETTLRTHLWPLVGTLFGLWLCLQGGRFAGQQLMDVGFSSRRFPVQAVDFLQHDNTGRPVFSPDFWGGYLIYRLYPQTRVVVDDRHDLYGAEFFKNYLNTIEAGPGWEQWLDQEKVDIALVPAGSALQNVLSLDAQWKLLYKDKMAFIFQRIHE